MYPAVVGQLYEESEEQRLCGGQLQNTGYYSQVRGYPRQLLRCQPGVLGGTDDTPHGLHQRVVGDFQQRRFGLGHGYFVEAGIRFVEGNNRSTAFRYQTAAWW